LTISVPLCALDFKAQIPPVASRHVTTTTRYLAYAFWYREKSYVLYSMLNTARV